MSEMIIQDTTDELDDLRGLGESDSVDELDELRGLGESDSVDELDELRGLGESDSVDELDDLRGLGESDSVDETVDDLRDLVADSSELAIETDNSIIKDDVLLAAIETSNPSAEKEEIVAPIETSPLPPKEAPVVTNTPESVVKAPVATIETSTKPSPIVEKASVTAPAKSEPTVQVASEVSLNNEEDIYQASFALKIFTVVRHLLIILFDIILTGIAIVVERIAALDWAGYRDHIMNAIQAANNLMKARIPQKYHIVVYALIAILLFGIPISVGAVAMLSGGDNLTIAQANQTINVNQQNEVLVNNGILAPLFTPTVHYWAEDIARWTANSDITPDMLGIVMQLESCGNPSVQGGLFGVGTDEDSFNDPETQAITAVERLQSALNRSNGDISMALAIYVDGEIVLHADFTTWTFHARDMFILGRNIHNQIQQGYSSSPDLNSWLQNTGAVLCTEAQTTSNN